MRKVLLLTFIAVSLAFSGCDKGGDDKTPVLDDRLVGTKWQTRDTVHELFYGGTAYDVYEFISTTEVDNYTIRNGSVVQSKGTYTYELNHPILIIHKDAETSYEYEFKDSRTIVRVGMNEYSPYMKYIRQ